MENSIKGLSAYRYSKALEDLKASELMLEESLYKVSINRSYYAIFHAMRAVTALQGYDSSKHSGIIAFFNQNFGVSQGRSFCHLLGVIHFDFAAAVRRLYDLHLIIQQYYELTGRCFYVIPE